MINSKELAQDILDGWPERFTTGNLVEKYGCSVSYFHNLIAKMRAKGFKIKRQINQANYLDDLKK